MRILQSLCFAVTFNFLTACSFQGPMHEEATAPVQVSRLDCSGARVGADARRLSDIDPVDVKAGAACFTDGTSQKMHKTAIKDDSFLAQAREKFGAIHKANVARAIDIVYRGGWVKDPNQQGRPLAKDGTPDLSRP